MNKLKVTAVAAIAAAIPAALFVAGMVVQANDQRLLTADDHNRTTLIARSCGKGQLLQDPFTNAYLCVWTNPDGGTVTEEIPPYPYLDQLAAR